MFPDSSPPLVEVSDRPLVLVIDDEYGPRESIAYTLSSEFNVVTASRASEGLARLRERAFSVVILDIRMPEMDGIRALEAIRQHDREISVVMLTGYGTLQTAQQSMVYGANQYLRKPPDISELMETVRSQSQAAQVRRHQAHLTAEMEVMNATLKREIEAKEPHIWQARAAVELVHDLANPLTVVIGYADLLVQEAKKMARREPEHARNFLNYADVVSRAAEYCHHLAENWKQTSRKTAEYDFIDLVTLVRSVKEVIFFNNPVISLTGVSQAKIHGSHFELTRVLQNLLKNAIESGASRVGVGFALNADQVTLQITDNGEGMDEDTAHKAMKGGFTTKTNGTGLGLGICRHLLAAHGATMKLESAKAKGTKILIAFPISRK